MSRDDMSAGADPACKLGAAAIAAADARLADTDAFLTRTYPGRNLGRQPVHTVYQPGDRFAAGMPADWGTQARQLLDRLGGADQLCAHLGFGAESDVIADRVLAKLDTEPIEDLRLDFEDGYGQRPDAQEDADVVRAAGELSRAIADGVAPPFAGIRFKCFEQPTRRRGIRTLDLFLSTMLGAGDLPAGLRITLPKVSTVDQVEVMAQICDAYEGAAGLPPGRLGFEIQVETPQLILGADGTVPLARALHAGRGRVTGLHYGTYDYSAALGVAAGQQSMEHPVADQAKQVMQLAAAGTGVQLSDGSTNVLPVGDDDQIRSAWRLHARLVRRSLDRAFYQGWDMHPGQLPSRYAATYAFYRQDFTAAADRLSAYVTESASAILDEPATARALAGYLHAGLVCGATTADEVQTATGLQTDQLERLAQPKSDTENLR
jgi:citrate lyase beta subunit